MNLDSHWNRHWRSIQKIKARHNQARRKQTRTRTTSQQIPMSYLISKSFQPCSVPLGMNLPKSWSRRSSRIWKDKIPKTLVASAKSIWARLNRFIRFYKRSLMTIWQMCKRMRRLKKMKRLKSRKRRKRRLKLPMKAYLQLRLKSLPPRLEHHPKRRRISLRILSLNRLSVVFLDTWTEAWSTWMYNHWCTSRTLASPKSLKGGQSASNKLLPANI